MNANAVLEARLRLHLDRFELNVDFSTTDRVTGLFGASGSGKSSLVESIAGLRRSARGRIVFHGDVWLDSERSVLVPPHRRGVGYVAQEALLFPHRNVEENLRSGSQRRVRRADSATYAHIVDVLELGSLLQRRTGTLSGGERQRVALGRALCSAPQLLLLDEPLSALDVGLRHRVLPFLQRVQAEFDIPMILVSHNPVEVQALCTDLIVLREGAIVARGEPRSVLTRPEVFPIAEHEGFENILPVVVAGERGRSSILRFAEGDGPEFIVPRLSAPEGTRLLASVPARDIIVARTRPTGLSARNILEASVEDVQEVGGAQLLTTRVSATAPPIIAEITADALHELGIGTGSQVYLIVKAHAIAIHGEGCE